jgi:hypothetical protein
VDVTHLRFAQGGRQSPIVKGKVQMMVKKAAVLLVGTVFVVACSQRSSPSSPSATALGTSSQSTSAGSASQSVSSALHAQGTGRVGFGFNGTVSGFPTGKVFLTGGGAFDRVANLVQSGGGFRCLDEDILQGPLSISINPNDPGPCRAGEGVRWDTAALLPSTTFKCTGAGTETLKTAVTSDKTVVLQADFYRASNGNEESFTAKIIVSDGDIASADFPGANLWVEKVGCGTALVNFNQ